ncbi:hypothetical protein FNU79_12835 [Deinococcus detaillensis]|uniref:CHRD domain-containing protein n=1 Tax=Deinococcus detaillensis TaxID=2592048 RepID=A0A553US03_9DEIO|nr:hypothetical protein [Deinococcus detaillensis]TSA83000.1 hypothetical protein FNU79_12835 [Deinococcus detaillensis]
MKTFTLLAALSAALCACGIVPLPAASIPDQTLTLPPSAGFESYVAYDGSDAFSGTSIPGILSNVSVSGQVLYAGAGDLQRVAVYLRSSLPSCNAVPGSKAQVCDASGEINQKVGTLTVQNGVVTGFSLSGSALDRAAKAGHGYFGVQAMQGQSMAGDSLKLTAMKASAKL